MSKTSFQSESMSFFCKLGFFALFLFLFGAVNCQKTESEAYVTLLYGDEFVLGVRVLGKSIRDTGSKKDMVVLVSDGVSDYAKKLLQADGWIVESISLLVNPNQIRPTRFWGVYTKLKIFNMTKYKKVVYLDADTIVVKSVEDLFQCSKFCANLKHSERMNSGVMVVEPSTALFKDMMSKVSSLPSYTGGDQGFLNSYYADFPNAHLFEPELSPEARRRRPVPKMERLSTLYNADVGLYMLANKWMVDEKELRVIHYTLGPLKPWDWWTAWLLKPVDIWQNVREQLEESLPGTKRGRNPKEQLLINILFALPVCALLFCYYRSCLQIKDFGRNSFCEYARRVYHKALLPVTYSGVGVTSSPVINSNQQFANGTSCKIPAYLGPLSICFCFASTILSLAIAFIVVPRQATPWTGLLLTYEWTFTMFALIFGCYLHFVRQWGKSTESHRMDSSDDDSHKGLRNTSSCDSTTLYYGAGMALLAVLAPSLPIMLGITALFARLGLMVVGGLVFASFTTYASEHLAIRFYLRGLEDRDKSRSVCFL